MTENIKGGARVIGSLEAPSSKSYAQRAVAAALIAEGTTTITNIDLSNDTSAALDVAGKLGARITDEGDGTYSIEGGINPRSHIIDIGESGLSTRMFTPIAALTGSPITITGKGSIMTRPLDMMIGPLTQLGIDISATKGCYLPVMVRGPLRGGMATVDGSLSSQFLTGLLMALPVAEGDSVIKVERLTSLPYIDMTLELLADFGVEIDNENYKIFTIKGGQLYRPHHYNVEGDWSGASCMLVAGAVAGSIEIANLNLDSCQADRVIIDALRMAGAEIKISGDSVFVGKAPLKAFEFDATQCPDLFPALAALAACCEGTSIIKGTTRLTHKESDRATTIASEFGKTGIAVDLSRHDQMRITGGVIKGVKVSSHNDHRIAMAMAVAGLVCQGTMEIDGSEAVGKSYPAFWGDLRSVVKI